MEPSTKKPLGAARIFALVVIGLTFAGLAYLRFAGGDAVKVPAGAHAGQLQLHDCGAADCGTLVVPEDRHDPSSRLIALPVKRYRARSASPGLPIFRLQGGPGITNMQFDQASRFTAKHDVVLVGYRGVDGSSRLDCPEVVDARSHARDFLTQPAYRAVGAAFRTCAQRLQHAGVDLAGYTLPERVDDLDAARRALGYAKIDLVSESAGTRTAMIYAWRYPKRIHRSLMIGVNPPGKFLWDARTTGEQIRRYAALCKADDACRSRTPDLAASLHSSFLHLPAHWWFLPIRKGDVQAAAFFGLMNATADGGGPLYGSRTIDTLLSAGQGDGGGAWFLSLMAKIAFPRAQVWGDVAAVARADTAYAKPFFAAHEDRGSVIGAPGTDLIWAGGKLLTAWPSNPDESEYTHVRDSNVPTMLVGGKLDFATPPQNATRELLPHLANGRQVLLSGLGHTDDFWTYEPRASTRLIDTFLERGRVDASAYTPAHVDFAPSVTHATIATILVAVMLSLAALAAALLLWMALRVQRRGRFGRKAGAALRSLNPIVLGLGGWFASVLIALTAFPTVPIDDELLAAFSIGLPIALGVYFAWVDRDWSPFTKSTGIAAAVAGALVGAWLGFHVIDGLFALVTAILGATAGANLTLLGLDVAWDTQRRERARPTQVGAADQQLVRAPLRPAADDFQPTGS